MRRLQRFNLFLCLITTSLILANLKITLKNCPLNCNLVKQDNIESSWILKPVEKPGSLSSQTLVRRLLKREKSYVLFTTLIVETLGLAVGKFSITLATCFIIILIGLKIITTKQFKKYYVKSPPLQSRPASYSTRPASVYYPLFIILFLVVPCIYAIFKILRAVDIEQDMAKDVVCDAIVGTHALNMGTKIYKCPNEEHPFIGFEEINKVSVIKAFGVYENIFKEKIEPYHQNLTNVLERWTILKMNAEALAKAVALFNNIPIEVTKLNIAYKQAITAIDKISVDFDIITNLTGYKPYQKSKLKALKSGLHLAKISKTLIRVGFFKSAVAYISKTVVDKISRGLLVLTFIQIIPGMITLIVFLNIIAYFVNRKPVTKKLLKFVLFSSYIQGIFVILLCIALVLLITAGTGILAGCQYFDKELMQNGHWSQIYPEEQHGSLHICVKKCINERRPLSEVLGNIENPHQSILDAIYETTALMGKRLNIPSHDIAYLEKVNRNLTRTFIYNITALPNVVAESVGLSGLQADDVTLHCDYVDLPYKKYCNSTNHLNIKGFRTTLKEFNRMVDSDWCIEQLGCNSTQTPILASTTAGQLLKGRLSSRFAEFATVILDKYKVITFNGYKCGNNFCNINQALYDPINAYYPKQSAQLIKNIQDLQFNTTKEIIDKAVRNNKVIDSFVNNFFKNRGYCTLAHDVAYTGISRTCNLVTRSLTHVIEACLSFLISGVIIFFVSFTVWVLLHS